MEKDIDPMYEHHRVAALPRQDYPAVRGLTVVWNEEDRGIKERQFGKD